MGAPDALYGVIYTPEELGAEVDASGEVLETVDVGPAPRVTRQRKPVEPVPVPEFVTEAVPEPDDVLEEAEAEPAATTAQITKVNILLQELGQTERAEKLMFLSDWTGRTITSSKDLTKSEAHRFIDECETPAVDADGVLAEVVN